MNKSLIFGLLALGGAVNAQVISSSKWSDIFSYNNVLCIRDTGDGKLIAATENGIFYYTPKTGEVSKLSKANGLHEVKISAFDYNPETKTGLVGYVNGSMDVITPNGIIYIVDIPIATGYTGSKKINHISITGNQAAVSVGYGVSVFNLDKKEFGDTAFFNTNGIYEPAVESVIKDKTVYSITSSGLKKHDINVTFPIYSEWQTVASGTFTNIDIDGSTISYSNDSQAWSGDGTVFTSLGSFPGIKDVVVNGSSTIITTATADSGTVYVNGSPTTYAKPLNTGFYNGETFAGSLYDGILDSASIPFKPDGPYNNQSYKIFFLNNEIWIASGIYYGFTPSKLGYYHFNGKEWVYPDYFLKNSQNYVFNITDIAVNPANSKQLFFTNSVQNAASKAIFRMEDDQFAKIYSEPSIPYIRVPVNVEFDAENNLFATKQWAVLAEYGKDIVLQTYNKSADSFEDLTQIVSQEVINMFTDEGVMYVSSPNGAGGSMILYDYNSTLAKNDDRLKQLTIENNLPANGTISSALDKNGDLWIGTVAGLRILQNPKTAVTNPKPTTEDIVISQNGIAEELFKDSRILAIAVDSGNNKWISVDGGGVYYLSPNGSKTLLHFTKANSPLPNNQVTDIKINDKTGDVYLVTREGIVVYHSDIVDVNTNFGNVLVYPNPVVYSNYKGNLHIKGLAEKTNIRIVDAAGNLVHQAVSRGGVYEWDLTNKGKRVASGIYFVLMTNADGTDKATAKIAVVN